MYHYINGIGNIWVGKTPPPEGEFPLNIIWLKATGDDKVWDLLAYDCNNLVWVSLGNGGSGGGSIDPGTISALVESVSSTLKLTFFSSSL